MNWQDGTFVNKMADPEQAYRDCREAHAWVSRELETARDVWATRQVESDSDRIRVYCLTQERKRLADIAWKLKRRI